MTALFISLISLSMCVVAISLIFFDRRTKRMIVIVHESTAESQQLREAIEKLNHTLERRSLERLVVVAAITYPWLVGASSLLSKLAASFMLPLILRLLNT